MGTNSDAFIPVSLEIGKKKVFASAIDWPGWTRGAKDEAAALEALLAYALRYAKALASGTGGAKGVPFAAPRGIEAFRVAERVEGGSSTDFGAPGKIPSADNEPLAGDELRRLQDILRACWAAFDAAYEAALRFEAAGKELRKGPRGGGRDAQGLYSHVLGGGLSYLSTSGGSLPGEPEADVRQPGGARWQMARLLDAMLETMEAGSRGEIPARGPRGGLRWPPRYLARRAAWHILDHLWEMEDRMGEGGE